MLAQLAIALLLGVGIQMPSADDIARQLDSTDARTAAWGAYYAAAYHREDMVPRLQRLLETPPTTGPQETSAFIGVLMDALILLNARVPARTVVSYVERQPVQAFVLLSNASEREAVLLDLLPRLSGPRWFAAADMLFDDRSPGLIAHLVRTVRLQLTVTVVDDEHHGCGLGGGLSGGVADGIGQNPANYPPHAEYRFESAPSRGFIVLTTGPHPVYYSRYVWRTFQYPISIILESGPTDEDRVEYLRAMTPDIGSNPFRADTIASVPWTTASDLVARVPQLRSEVERRFRGLVDRARQSRPGPGDLVVEPRIEIRLLDCRTDTSVALPKIGG
jgi:hypothetical protein